jgi:hypothetical protein
MANWTRNFSPQFINEFRFGYVRGFLDFPENDPKIPSTGIAGVFSIGGLSEVPQGRLQDSDQFQNTGTHLMNRHSLQFGVDLR